MIPETADSRAGPDIPDYLIVGQGLAGSVLALLMRRRGLRFRVVDNANPSGATRVAAGILNPVTGRKIVKSWRADESLPSAFAFYREAERELGVGLLGERIIHRYLVTGNEREIWRRKRDQEGWGSLTSPLPEEARPGFRGGLQGFRIHGGGILDAPGFVEAVGLLLLREGNLLRAELPVESIRISTAGVEWEGVRARRVIFCEGHRASRNPLFSWLPFRHAKGETLTLRWDGPCDDRIHNFGKWLFPLGGGEARAGSTFKWADLTETTTDAGRAEILDGLARVLPVQPEVIGQRAGIRPILKDSRPVAGLHPGHPNAGIFNGLGSKGVSLAPLFAEQFLNHLESGGPLDDEIDARRNL